MSENSHMALVIGDIMLDNSFYGTVKRISPEAPCPVFNISSSNSSKLGGAAGVANQLAALDIHVVLCGIIASDKSGERVLTLAEKSLIDTTLISKTGSKTTTKTRFIAGEQKQQVFRVDDETTQGFDEDGKERIISFIKNNGDRLQFVVLVDYSKGVLDLNLCQSIIHLCKDLSIPTYVDVKSPLISKYKGANFVKGNRNEISQMIHYGSNPDSDYVELKNVLGCDCLIITCGANGITFIGPDNCLRHDWAISHELFDVTGAGDTVTSFFVASLLHDLPIADAVRNSNKAAGLKVSIPDCPLLSWNDINGNGNHKLLSKDSLKTITENRKRIVFTNGCFDIIHSGHIDLLKTAASYGDLLVVGLNSDDSVRRLKGNSRPINSIDERVAVLSAIAYVDYIVVFDEDTPINLIHALHPNVIVKGGDYSKESVVGADFVEANGGEVIIVPISHQVSSTSIVNRIRL